MFRLILLAAVISGWVGSGVIESGEVVTPASKTVSFETVLVAVSAQDAYTSTDSLKINGGRFDYIAHSGNSSGEFLSGFIKNSAPTAVKHNDDVNKVVIGSTSGSYWAHSGSQISMVHMPMDDFPNFYDSDTEVLWAKYYVTFNSASVLATTDTMYVVGGDRADMDWGASGTNNTSRNFMNHTGTVNWPTRNGSTDPINWLGLDAVSTLDITAHPYVVDTTLPTSEPFVFDVTPWATTVSAGGLNGGLWYLGHRPSTSFTILPVRETNNTSSKRPLMIIKYSRKAVVTAPVMQFTSFPVYANYNQGEYNTPFTSVDYDSISTLDVLTVQMQLYDDDDEAAMVDYARELKTRNPDIILLDYLYLWGIESGWATHPVGSIRRDWYDFVIAGDYLLYLANESLVTYIDDTFGATLVNFTGSDGVTAPTAIAEFFADYINSSENSVALTGVFIDFMYYSNYPNWPCEGGCLTVMDLDNDQVAYPSDSADELAKYKLSCITFVDVLRANVDEPDFVIAVNGPAYTSSEFSSHIEFGMAEDINISSPNDKSSWLAHAGTYRTSLSSDVVIRAGVMMDVQGNASDGTNPSEESVIVASLLVAGMATLSTDAPVDGRRIWTPMRSSYGKLSIGTPVGDLRWPGSPGGEAYRQYTNGYVKALVDPDEPYPYEYVLVDSVSFALPDSIFLSDGWPREEP